MTSRVIEQVCSLGDSRYLISPKSAGFISIPKDSSIEQGTLPCPITVVHIDGLEVITSAWLQKTIDDMLASDDVFCEDFLSCILFQKVSEGQWPKVADDLGALWKPCPIWDFYTGDLPPGPYFVSNSGIHKVFKLFPDPCGAFIYGVVQSEEDPDSYRRVLDSYIPIQSRLYYPQATPAIPLYGKRVAVKDIYDIRGLKTSVCSKAYDAFHEEATGTADAIQKLIDLGAVIVGKTKTVQFASGMAARDWVDYQCPFNPRGDGYLDTDCSSSGSAAAVAGYDWLDFSIGSDSLGSMVGPAAACGIFGLRPSHGALSNDGALAVSSLLDTPGNFSRDVADFSTFTNFWLGSNPSPRFEAPTRILFPAERFGAYQRSKLEVMESFICDIEKTMQVRRSPLDINALWKLKAPDHATSASLDEFLATTLAHIQLHDSYQNNLKFRSEYKAKSGREPYVDPLIQYKWDLGSKLTNSDYKQACNEKATFKRFLEEHVFTEGTVLLLPGGDTDITYRDEYSGSLEESGKKWQGFGFGNTAFSVLGEGPSISFPVGQRLYHSRVTGKEEYQPVSMMLLGAAGTDQYLIDLIKHVLQATGRPLSVKIGQTAF